MKTAKCPKKAYLGLIFSALLIAYTATAEEFDFLGVDNPNAPQAQPENITPPQQNEPAKPSTPVSDVAGLVNDENSVLALDTALFNSEADEVMSDYIKDLEDAQTARESATDVLSKRPQKILVKIKPRPQKETLPETETPDDESAEEAIEHEMTSPLADETETPQPQAEEREEENVSNDQTAAKLETTAEPETTTKSESVADSETASESENVTDSQTTAESEIATSPQPAAETSPAPFGLTWGASKQELEATHPILEKAERDGYQNVWRLSSNAQSASFAEVVLIFGEQDKLWCIYAESKPQPDDAHASKILALYHKYYDALSKKYGHAEETFIPAENKTEQTDQDGQTETLITYGTLGDENFLADLAAEKTSLFATFYDDEVGATLSIAADDKQTYLVLDYKNLPLMNAEKKQKINSLIQDLEGL